MIPAHCSEAERAVLGILLLEPGAISPVIEGLEAPDFSTEQHRAIFNGIRSLFQRAEPVDVITLTDELRRSGNIEQAGGPLAVAALAEEAATAAHLRSYVKILQDLGLKRRISGLGERLIRGARNGQPASVLLEMIESGLAEMRAPARRATPQAREAGDLLRLDTTDEPAIVADGIVARASLGVLGAPPKLGKSSLALNLTLRRSMGLPWLGFPTTPGRTLVIQAEIPERELQTRFRIMLQDLGDTFPPDRLFFVTHRGMHLDQPAGLQECRRLVEEIRPDLLVIDPLARFFTGDENSARDIGRLIGALDELVQGYAAAVLLVHHTSKPVVNDPKEGGLKLRGSSALFGAADTVLVLEKAGGGLFRLGFELRHAKEPEPMLLRRTDRLWFESAGPPQELLDVAALVRNTSLRWGQLIQAIQVDQTVSKRTAERLLDRVKKAGMIALDGSGEYRSTATGCHETTGGELN